MTRRTFYRNLRKAAPLFNWELRNGMIRGKMKWDGNSILHCPLTAVCQIKKRRAFSKQGYRDAGDYLGMILDDTMAIARNADRDTNNQIRKALLRAIFPEKKY